MGWDSSTWSKKSNLSKRNSENRFRASGVNIFYSIYFDTDGLYGLRGNPEEIQRKGVIIIPQESDLYGSYLIRCFKGNP